MPLIAQDAGKKQISIYSGAVTGVFYTVPAGKKFVGYIMTSGGNSAQVNGVTTPIANYVPPPQIELVSGSTLGVNNAAYPVYVLGIEQ